MTDTHVNRGVTISHVNRGVTIYRYDDNRDTFLHDTLYHIGCP
jgi:hypothetical protein